MSAETAADLRAAADVLRRDGWTAQCRRDGTTGHCVTNAIGIAIDPTGWDSDTGWDDGTYRRFAAATQALRTQTGNPRIGQWEEADRRTADEVIAALDAAAAAEATS